MAETKGKNAKLTPKMFPLLFTQYELTECFDPGRTAALDLADFKYKGVQLSCTLMNALDGADSQRRSEKYCQEMLLKETNALFAALLYFWTRRFEECKGAYTQRKSGMMTGMKKSSGDKKTHTDLVDTRAFIKLCTGCFDLKWWLVADDDDCALPRLGGEEDVAYLRRLHIGGMEVYHGREELAQILKAADSQIWTPMAAPSEEDLWEEYVRCRFTLTKLLIEEPQLFAALEGDEHQLNSSDIKAIIFTHPCFEVGFENVLCLLLYCLTMGACEDTVEGVGKNVNDNANGTRHLAPEAYNAASKVQLNGPALSEADDFIWAVLQRRFPQTAEQKQKGQKGPLNAFSHVSPVGQLAQMARGRLGLVLEDVAANKSRLSFMV